MKWLVALSALLPTTAAVSDGRFSDRRFESEVRPILVRSCVSCHGPAVSKAGIRLDRPVPKQQGPRVAAVLAGTGPVSMPPSGPLPQRDTAVLREWLASGARFPSTVVGGDPTWAFRPLGKPVVPVGAVHPVDAFLQARLRTQGVPASRPADRRTLLRRATFDLTGLPPTPEELDRFLSDRRPGAWERVVDRLLASSAYGERQARWWLDIAHYGDTHGYDKDKRRENAWPYRDWLVSAFNRDIPWSDFVQDQIAGDVRKPEDASSIVATGFLSAGPWDFVGQVELAEGTVEKEKTRVLDRDDMVSSVMSSFASVTVHCARCHDHKFDPITQKDYYALQAVFSGVERGDRVVAEGLERGGGGSPTNGWHSPIERTADTASWVSIDLGRTVSAESVRLVPARPTDFPDTPGFGFPVRWRVDVATDPMFLTARCIARHEDADFPSPGDSTVDIPAGGAPFRFVRVTAQRLWKRTDDFVFALAELQVVSGNRNLARGVAVQASGSIEAGRWSSAALVDGHDSRGSMGRSSFAVLPREPREIRLLARGEVGSPGDRVEPAALACVRGVPAALGLTPNASEGQRRLALARWLVAPGNSIVWRSIANRLWAMHFGAGLVDTPNDFGAQGGRPTHPELLDWLAASIRDGGGRLKRVHRLLLLSSAYRRSSLPTALAQSRDSGNRLVSHMPRRRLDAEEVRDAILAAAGTLDRTMGGPGFALFQFKDDHSPIYDHDAVEPVLDTATFRRTVYRFVVRSVPNPFLDAFDAPDPNSSVPLRNTTLTSLQALALRNDAFVLDQSGRFARSLEARFPRLADRIIMAFRRALGRSPTALELSEATVYVARQGLPAFCRVLFNTSEFVFVD